MIYVAMLTEPINSRFVGKSSLTGLWKVCPLSAHDQQALCDISFTNLAVHIRDALPRRFSDLAVFDARLYIRVRRIDEPA